MKEFILILIFVMNNAGYSGGNAVATTSIVFSSKEACQKALDEIKRERNGTALSICVEK